MKASLTGGLVFLSVLALAAIASERTTNVRAAAQADRSAAGRILRLPETPYGYERLELPPHFSTPLIQQVFDNAPPHNPVTDAGATLGRVLFYDTRLSANGTISCGSCHVQAHAFDDPNAVSRGFEGLTTDRHAMNLVNLRFNPRKRFFWDERGGNLEDMVLLPVVNRIEMGQDLAKLPGVLARAPYYPDLFRQAFGDPEITTERMARALAQFLRAMVSYQSRYDEGRAQVTAASEDFPNFSRQENRGKALFLRNCAICHLSNQEALFVMTAPANTGLDEDVLHADGGLGDITLNPRELGLFRSPSLRNAALTAPYMHDGRFATLDAVIDHYSTGGKDHPNRDIRVQPLNFTESEKAALIAFLETLTDPKFVADPRFADPFE